MAPVPLGSGRTTGSKTIPAPPSGTVCAPSQQIHRTPVLDREAEEGFRSISVPIRRYDGAVVAAANIGAHVDRITTGEMIDRFLPLLNDMAASAKPLLV